MSLMSDHKEVVRIQVKKTDGFMQPEMKNLCVDPQITSYEMLQSLLARAFDIRSNFTMSYLATDDTGEEVYLSLLSDWDLDAAFFGASNPVLRLKVDVRPFEEAVDDWEITAQPIDSRKTAPSIVAGATSLINTSNMIIDGFTKTVSNVTKAIGLRAEEVITTARDSRTLPLTPTRPMLSDAEFHTYLDAVGRLIRPQQFRVAVYQGGVESSLRPVVWRHLLNIYPGDMTGRERFDYVRRKSNEYYRLRSEWLGHESADAAVQLIANMVRKDVHRTDRLHPFYAGDDNANVIALFNLLVTFALTHPQLSYWQGMSDIASPILAVQGDEAAAYVSFCSLMRRVGSSFAADGKVMATRFRQLALLLQHYDGEFYAHICKCGASDMFFTYRWLLLEMKREFPLDDAMFALEVMWSSLPLDPPDGDLPLFDESYKKMGAAAASTAACHVEAYVHLRSTQRRLSEGHSKVAASTASKLTPTSPDSRTANGTVAKQADDTQSPSGKSGTGDMPKIAECDEPQKSTCSSSPKTSNSLKQKSSPTGQIPGRAVRSPTTDLSPTSSSNPTVERPSSKASLKTEHTDNVVDKQQRPKEDESKVDEGESENEDEQTKLLDVNSENGNESSARVSPSHARIPLLPLPPPSELGCGNPFLMFVCLSTLLLQRNRVMSSCVDYNDIAMHYDKMVRQHRVEPVINYARQLYASYLKRVQQQQQPVQDCSAGSSRSDADDDDDDSSCSDGST